MSFQPVSKYTRQLMEQQNSFSYKPSTYNVNETPTRLGNANGIQSNLSMSLKDTLS